MCAVACERGAANATVADVVARSGVSRRTFYEVFSSGEECLLAALAHALRCAREYLCAAHDPAAPWQARIRAGVEAFLAFIEDHPAMGRLVVVESLGAGPLALERRALALAAAVREVDSGRSASRSRAGLTALTAEGAVGAVLSVLHAQLLDRKQGSLAELCSPLTSMVLLPYVGAAAASRELDRPARPRVAQAPAQAPVDHLNKLPMRLTYRTVCVLSAVAEQPGASNRQIGQAGGIADQGQISKLLRRLERLGLVENQDVSLGRGAPNRWTLTPRGAALERSLRGQGTADGE